MLVNSNIGMDIDALYSQQGDETAITVNAKPDAIVISLGQ